MSLWHFCLLSCCQWRVKIFIKDYVHLKSDVKIIVFVSNSTSLSCSRTPSCPAPGAWVLALHISSLSQWHSATNCYLPWSITMLLGQSSWSTSRLWLCFQLFYFILAIFLPHILWKCFSPQDRLACHLLC